MKRHSNLFTPFAVGLAAIVLLGAVLRFSITAYSLPYVDHPDEPAYYLGAQFLRGLYDDRGYYAGVPPGYLWLSAAGQTVLSAAGQGELAPHVQMFRWLSAGIDLVTISLLALTARQALPGVSGVVGGWLAGALWAVSPQIVANSIHALPDPYVYFCTALALFWAGLALQRPAQARLYSLASISAALVGVVFKYPALPALLPGGIAILALLRQDRRRGLSALLAAAALTAAVGLWLFFGYGITFQREGATVRDQGLTNLLDFSRLGDNLVQTAGPLGLTLTVTLLALGALVFVGRRRWQGGGLALLCGSLVLGVPWLTASYTVVSPSVVRYVLPAVLALCVMLGLTLGNLLSLLPARLRLGLGLAAIALILAEPLTTTGYLIRERQRPDSRVALHRWFDANLEVGNVVVDPLHEKVFNPSWGGLRLSGGRWVDGWETRDLWEHTPAEWQARGFVYAIVAHDQWLRWQANARDQAYLDQMLYLRAFADASLRGPQSVVLRFALPQQPMTARFGESVQLVGMDQLGVPQPGGMLQFRFYWNAPRIPDDNYSLFMHWVGVSDTAPLAQWDGPPGPETRPTLSWDAPDETIISPWISLTLPQALPPGRYLVRIGLYNYETGVREAVTPTGEDALTVFTFDWEGSP